MLKKMNLTKKYRVAIKDNIVLSIGKYDDKSVTGCIDGFECDNKDELLEGLEGLVLTDEQKEELNNFKD